MEKGKLIYRMPDEIYKKNRRGGLFLIYALTGWLIFVIGAIILFSYWGFIGYGWGPAIFMAFIFICVFSVLISGLKDYKLTRFEIYENGYISCKKPVSYVIGRKEYFVRFDDIVKIDYFGGGINVLLTLKNGNKKVVGSWNDVEGYIKFSEIMKKRFPNQKYPDFEIIKKYLIAHRDWLNKKISKKEMEKIFVDEVVEINKDFCGWIRKDQEVTFDNSAKLQEVSRRIERIRWQLQSKRGKQ